MADEFAKLDCLPDEVIDDEHNVDQVLVPVQEQVSQEEVEEEESDDAKLDCVSNELVDDENGVDQVLVPVREQVSEDEEDETEEDEDEEEESDDEGWITPRTDKHNFNHFP